MATSVLKTKLRISNTDVESFRLISNYSDSGERNRREKLFNGKGDVLTPAVCGTITTRPCTCGWRYSRARCPSFDSV